MAEEQQEASQGEMEGEKNKVETQHSNTQRGHSSLEVLSHFKPTVLFVAFGPMSFRQTKPLPRSVQIEKGAIACWLMLTLLHKETLV